ncbi:MAG: EstA family serine hydrolase [Acidimicrobiia bacterium]|nr:EstA family serine hydrolase [Acidimicrobiia bacterium]
MVQPALAIEGFCDPKFKAVQDVFAQNWELFAEVGASVAATVDGVPVFDLWGGWADAARERPWQRDTIVVVASTTKGLTGICGNIAIDRGLLDPEAPAATYWPEFAANGKGDVPVKYLFNHTVGLPDLAPGVNILDWEEVVESLAAAAPKWTPGTKLAYHSITYGFLVGELVRRVTGQSLGSFLRSEVCEPLGADAWIGLPEALDERVAELVGADVGGDPQFRRAEIPAGNGHTNARALARIYSALACGGSIDGVHLLSKQAIDDATFASVTGPWEGGLEQVIAMFPALYSLRFSRGFKMNSTFTWMGPNSNAFGDAGSGGSISFADPVARVSFGYAQNAHLGPEAGINSRPGRVIQALYECL